MNKDTKDFYRALDKATQALLAFQSIANLTVNSPEQKASIDDRMESLIDDLNLIHNVIDESNTKTGVDFLTHLL